MDITVKNLQTKITLNTTRIEKITSRIIKKVGIRKVILSVVFVSGPKIKALNKKFLGRDYATDVLAFDWKLGNGAPLRGINKSKRKELCGDIIISTDAIRQNASAFRTSLSHELVLYIIHGILHLMGFDDHNPSDIKRMRQEEAKLMKYLGNTTEATVRKA
jgi:probable rRNA maturation factor